ncbi:MAG: hypothetical protein AAF830_02875 [Pseudomonadota bacterium]
MTFLVILLLAKIAVTLLAVALPFLALPKPTLDRLAQFDDPSPTLYRLYGMAVTALLVGYTSGLVTALGGVFPWSIIAMGIASNAGATLILIITGAARTRVLSTLFFGAIATGLILAALFPQAAMQPLL